MLSSRSGSLIQIIWPRAWAFHATLDQTGWTPMCQPSCSLQECHGTPTTPPAWPSPFTHLLSASPSYQGVPFLHPPRTGQCLTIGDFLLRHTYPPSAHHSCHPVPGLPPDPTPELTSSTWGPRPSRIRCAASAFFCRVTEKTRN